MVIYNQIKMKCTNATLSITARNHLPREGQGGQRYASTVLRQTQQTYEALEQLEGIGGGGITNASQIIDELLYGENGSWRGEQ